MHFVLNADLTFNGGGGTDSAMLFDGSSTVSFPYALSSSSFVRGASPIDYSSLERIQLSGASGTNAIAVSSLGATTAVTLGGGAGNDTFSVGGAAQNLDNIDGSLTLDGGTGTDALELRDQQNVRNDPYTVNTTNFDRPSFGSLNWSAMEGLTVQGSAGGNLFQLPSTAAAQPVALNGNGGADHFAIGGTSQAVVGTNFASNVTVDGGEGTDTVTIFDNNGTGTHAYTVNASTFDKTDFSLLNYSAAESFVVQANPSSNTFNIESLAAGTSLIAIGNGGNETYNLALTSGSLASLPSPITINGGVGIDQILLFDGANAAGSVYTITHNLATRPGFGGLTYGGSNDNESLFVAAGAGGDTFDVNSMSIPVTVGGGNGDDQVTVGGGNFTANVTSTLRVLGGGGTNDRLTVNDAATSAAGNYTLSAAAVSKVGAPAVSYDSMERVTVGGTQGANTFTVRNVPATVTLALDGNGGADAFDLGDETDLLEPLDGSIAIDGGAGADTVNANDQGNVLASGFTLTPTNFTRAGMGAASYIGVEQINLGSGGGATKTHTIDGTAAGTPVRLNPGPSRDVIRVLESAATAPVTVGASTGADGVDVNTDNTGAAAVLFDSSLTLGSLQIGAGGAATTEAGGAHVLRTTLFGLHSGAQLDLADNTLLVDYSGASPLASVAARLTSGYADGAWNGNGIRSSVAAATPGRALGYAEASALFGAFPVTFAGQSIDSTTVIVRYTRYGDANLDRAVNLQDFNRLAGSFGSGTLWSQGNFNYDAAVNLTDFNLLAGNFGESGGGDEARLPGLPGGLADEG
jgi:hypothetical protein